MGTGTVFNMFRSHTGWDSKNQHQVHTPIGTKWDPEPSLPQRGTVAVLGATEPSATDEVDVVMGPQFANRLGDVLNESMQGGRRENDLTGGGVHEISEVLTDIVCC